MGAECGRDIRDGCELGRRYLLFAPALAARTRGRGLLLAGSFGSPEPGLEALELLGGCFDPARDDDAGRFNARSAPEGPEEQALVGLERPGVGVRNWWAVRLDGSMILRRERSL